MLITDKNELKNYYSNKRIWQGIPGIERTKKGRIFSVFYSGSTGEQLGNYVVLLKSDDDGKTFSEPILAVDKPGEYRCYDAVLWIDPKERLWLIWAVMPEHSVWGCICENPDSDELIWSDEFEIGGDVCMNKPTVLSTGEWLFPSAVWSDNAYVLSHLKTKKETGAFVYKTSDNGKTFTKLGTPEIKNRSFDEHMVLELKSGVLLMLIRTLDGIAQSYSYDRGETWTDSEIFNQPGPVSRFFIRRLKSGRVLLINHYEFTGRNNLYALLSDDECKTWKYKILLDERTGIAYPDAAEADNGYIYITYDRERGGFKNSFEEAKLDAREILMAKITEDDIMSGKIISPESRLKVVISKLSDYDGDADLLYKKYFAYKAGEMLESLKTASSKEEILDILFRAHSVNCQNMHSIDIDKMNGLIENLDLNSENFEATLKELDTLLRTVKTSKKENRTEPIVDMATSYITSHVFEDINVSDLADICGVSMFYLCHLFKSKCGVSILEYRDTCRMNEAKKLLIGTDMPICKIAEKCGFTDDSYFTKRFKKLEKITPTVYREYHK